MSEQQIVEEVLAMEESKIILKKIEDRRSAILNFLIGQVMKTTKGANPVIVRRLLIEELSVA